MYVSCDYSKLLVPLSTQTSFFTDDPQVSTLMYLDNLYEKPELEKSQFFKVLPKIVVPYSKVCVRVALILHVYIQYTHYAIRMCVLTFRLVLMQSNLTVKPLSGDLVSNSFSFDMDLPPYQDTRSYNMCVSGVVSGY